METGRIRVRVSKVSMVSRRTMRRRLDRSFRETSAKGWIELWQSTWASLSRERFASLGIITALK